MKSRTGTGIRVEALRYERHGLPAEVLEAVSLELPALRAGPSTGLRAGEVLVAMRAGAIHYSDLGLLNGTYGRLRALPAIGGREGVGEVVELGPGVRRLAVGALVRMPEAQGVWREAVVAKSSSLYPIPAGVALEQAALAFINPPTAWRLLHDFVKLRKGDWLIQNAGTSAVGVLVAQLSRYLGIKCVSVVRDLTATGRLREAGAAAVVGEDSGYEKNPTAITKGAPLRLALNAVGGESAGRLCRAVARGGVVVTYGGVTAEPMRFPTRPLIFNDITLKGFWMDEWVHTQPASKAQALWGKLFGLLREGVISQRVVARYSLGEWRAALEHAFRDRKGGKVIFVSKWRP